MDENEKCSLKNSSVPKELAELLDKVPAFRYMLPPVNDIDELYVNYKTNKLERNNFAYVYEQNTFYIWREVEDKYEQYGWYPMSLEVGVYLFPQIKKYLLDNLPEILADPKAKEALTEVLGDIVNEKLDEKVETQLNQKYLFKDKPDQTEHLLKFLDGAEFGEFIDSLFQGQGAKIDKQGNAQVESLVVRGPMIVQELIINRARVNDSKTFYTEGSIIDRVETLSNGMYILHLRKETEHSLLPFEVHDVLYGEVNVLETMGKEASTWLRVTNTNQDNFTINVILYRDEETPNKLNARPIKSQNVIRWGNAVNSKRQRLWFTSSHDGREVFLMGVDKPILEFKNFAMFNGLPPMEFEELQGLPINPNQPYMFARGIIAQDIIRINYQGLPVKTIEDLGLWKPGMQCQDGNEKPFIQNDVWHNGCKWRCIKTTTSEPSILNTDWVMVSGNEKLSLELHSDGGNIYRPNTSFKINIEAKVFMGNEDITAFIDNSDWKWTRETGNINGDNSWNEKHAGTTHQLTITEDDMEDLADYTKFICTAYVRDGKEIKKIEKENRI